VPGLRCSLGSLSAAGSVFGLLEGVIKTSKNPRVQDAGAVVKKIVRCMRAVICTQYIKATITGARGVLEEPLPNRDDISRLGLYEIAKRTIAGSSFLFQGLCGQIDDQNNTRRFPLSTANPETGCQCNIPCVNDILAKVASAAIPVVRVVLLRSFPERV
jgi:hypothetical protein